MMANSQVVILGPLGDVERKNNLYILAGPDLGTEKKNSAPSSRFTHHVEQSH